MVANDNKEIESLITDLHKWQPCAVSLRKSGLPLIFYDVKVWEDAKVYDKASKLRTKFSSIMQSDRKNKSADLTAPFNSMSPLQFRQTVYKMEAFVQGGHIVEAKKGLYKKLAYHLVMNNFTVPQSLEGLKVESCKAFAKSIHEVTALSRAIANGTAIAADARSRLMMARTAEFRSAIDLEKMVNAWEVTRHWDGHHLQAASAKLLKDFAGIGVEFKKMRPRQVAEQLAKAQKQGKDVFRPVMGSISYASW